MIDSRIDRAPSIEVSSNGEEIARSAANYRAGAESRGGKPVRLRLELADGRGEPSRVQCSLLTPYPHCGQIAPVDVEIFPTTAVIRKGHRLRFTVAGFDVPHLLAPLPDLPGQALPITLYTGPKHPSRITFPGRQEGTRNQGN